MISFFILLMMLTLMCWCCFFFFSSRRRHTRWNCDWSSDVCSSDLACLDHRTPQLRERLVAACPKGIDVYFESVGGEVLYAVMPLLNVGARVPLCGQIGRASCRERV